MISSVLVTQKIYRLVGIVHLRLFGHEMGQEMRKFLENLSWSFFGGVIAASVTFAVNIIAGRLLGPEEYGKYSLVFLISQIFLIPMIFGMDMAISRVISKEAFQKVENIRKNISSAFWFVFFISMLSLIVATFFDNFFSGIFSTTSDIVLFGVLLSFILGIKNFLDGIARGFQLFNFQAKLRIFEGLFVAVAFFVIYTVFGTYTSVASAFILAGVLIVFWYLLRFREFIVSVPNLISLKSLLHYSKFVVASALVTLVVGYGDRFVVNKYFGPEELGLYSAYYAATIFVIGQMTVIMNNVFFPVVSKTEKKILIMKKVDKLVRFGSAPVFLGVFLVGFLVLSLFGSEYELDFFVLSLFSIVAVSQFFVAFYGNIVAAHSPETYFLGLKFYFIRACVYTGYIVILVLTNTLSVQAILLGLVVNYIVDGFNLRYILKKYC